MGTIYLIFQQSLPASFVIERILATSTAFVLQLLEEKNNNSVPPMVSNPFRFYCFQDIAAIPLLAIIPLLAGSESSHHGVAYFAAIIATFTGLFLF